MNYDVQLGSMIRRGIPYAELIMLPIEAETFVRRERGEWIHAKDCIELSHILVSTGAMPQVPPNLINDYDEDEFYEDDDYPDEYLEDNEHYGPANYAAEQFIPTAEYFKCKQKRKAAIIGICTMGLAGLSLTGIGSTWRSNIFAGTSFSANAGIGFILKCLSFCLLTMLIAVPYFVYSVFALIYYSIRLNKLKR